MRLLPRFARSLAVLFLGLNLATPNRQAMLWAGDLDQLLKAAIAKAKPESESDKSDDEQPAAKEKDKEESGGAKKDEDTGAASQSKPAAESAESKPKPKYPPYAEVLKDATKIDGIITLHRKDDQLFAELGPRQLDRDYIVLITIARGIGQTPILGGGCDAEPR